MGNILVSKRVSVMTPVDVEMSVGAHARYINLLMMTAYTFHQVLWMIIPASCSFFPESNLGNAYTIEFLKACSLFW